MKSEAALHEIGVMAMTAQSDPHASAAVYRQALIDICNFALQVQAGRAAALDAAPSPQLGNRALDFIDIVGTAFDQALHCEHTKSANLWCYWPNSDPDKACAECRALYEAILRFAALARSAPAEKLEAEKNEKDHTRVDGVPSDRPLGSTASSHEVK